MRKVFTAAALALSSGVAMVGTAGAAHAGLSIGQDGCTTRLGVTSGAGCLPKATDNPLSSVTGTVGDLTGLNVPDVSRLL